MSRKLVFLLFGTLLLAQCILAKTSSEEDDKSDSSEDKMDEDRLIKHVTKGYNKLVKKTVESTKRHMDGLIDDAEKNKITVNPKLHEKLNELKTVLEKAKKTTTDNSLDLNEKKRKNKHNMNDLGKICKEMVKIEEETTDPKDGDKAVHKAHEEARDELNENVTKFAEHALRDVEKHLNTLPATEQKKKHHIRDTLNEVKTETTTEKRMELLDRIFIFTEDNEGNKVTKD